jgi:predicted DNA-binding transcriptional regulator AlpA
MAKAPAKPRRLSRTSELKQEWEATHARRCHKNKGGYLRVNYLKDYSKRPEWRAKGADFHQTIWNLYRYSTDIRFKHAAQALEHSADVQGRYKISDSTLYRWERDETLAFPQPLIVNRRKLYQLGELVAWERSRAAVARSGRGA